MGGSPSARHRPSRPRQAGTAKHLCPGRGAVRPEIDLDKLTRALIMLAKEQVRREQEEQDESDQNAA